ncbi:18620_t:CDS:2 [Funneliformis geosporum]|nr:18620_t:CDS:2 [Funneliformis geosporum]
MVNAQEWLISNIPIEQKSQVKQIYIHLESHVPNLHTMNLTDYFNSSQREQQRVNDLNQLNHLISPNTSYNFQTLQQELKRLKIQDLTIQIPLKKQELEQLTSTAQEKLTRAERYPLEKLLKKHSKVLQNNSNLEKINELKEILSEKLTNEEAQNLLNKQKEIFNLEKHLGNLRTEQVAQIQQANLPSNS